VGDPQPPAKGSRVRLVIRADAVSDGVSESGIRADKVATMLADLYDVETVTFSDAQHFDWHSLPQDDRFVILASTVRIRYGESARVVAAGSASGVVESISHARYSGSCADHLRFRITCNRGRTRGWLVTSVRKDAFLWILLASDTEHRLSSDRSKHCGISMQKAGIPQIIWSEYSI
jgi:hypothetical protein